jgi:hypothetical protein
LRALRIPRARCRSHAERFSWRAATDQFLAMQAPMASTAAVTTAASEGIRPSLDQTLDGSRSF